MFKRFTFASAALILILILISCAPAATPPASTPAGTSSPATPAAGQPKPGGTLTIAVGFVPPETGYYPEFLGPINYTARYYVERLAEIDQNGNLEPQLATSWDVDPANKTITWHLRQGVKFHDNTDFNAEAAKWTFDDAIAKGMLQYKDAVKSIEVMDPYTLRFNLSSYNTRMVQTFGWVQFFSPTAFKTNGIEWARTHEAGTGPYMLTDFKRGTSLSMVKNPNYWMKGLPYIDKLEVRCIPNPVTASAAMQAGEIDAWLPGKMGVAVGMSKQPGYGLIKYDLRCSGEVALLSFDSANPNSPFSKVEVRQAVEYALNKKAMSDTLLYGMGQPLDQLAVPGSNIYVDGYKGRGFDVSKAKQLLAQAGYPNGFSTTFITCGETPQPYKKDIATVIQGYLGDIGITVKVDVADYARYQSMRTKGWSGIYFDWIGIEPNAVIPYTNRLGTLPSSWAPFGEARTQAYESLVAKLPTVTVSADEIALVKQMVKQAADDAIEIPLFVNPLVGVVRDYVHYDPIELYKNPAGYLRTFWLDKK